MSLFDHMATASGSPTALYINGGTQQKDETGKIITAVSRTVMRVRRVSYREATADQAKPSFRVDGTILKSTNPNHAANHINLTGTVNLSFRFAQPDLARARRMLAAMATSAGIGIGADGICSEDEAASRKDEFIGQAQPLVGSVVTVVATEAAQKNTPDKPFTQYEIEVPTDADLEGVL